VTYTEHVHVTFGILAAITGALALWHAFHPRSRTRFVWPVLAFIIGFCLFVPVEAQTRNYAQVGWWGTLISLVPANPKYWIHNWFAVLPQWHVVQHKLGSLMIMIVGVVAWRDARGRLASPAWRFVLPVLLVAIGVAFGVHGGSEHHLMHRSEQIHHQILGVCFTVAGVVQGMVEAGRLRGPWRGVWAALVLAVGLDIAFFYRLAPGDLHNGGHAHASADTRLR
jgi:uncharacterized membrane protein HdeD (DUF308 family)